MSVAGLLLIALALSIDAWAVSLSCGMKLQRVRPGAYLKIALCFGGAQALMPALGWGVGAALSGFVDRYSPLVAAVVFGLLGVKACREAFSHKEEKCDACQCSNVKCLTSLTVATSIDAFVIGAVLALSQVSMPLAVSLIGGVTFSGTFVALYLGHKGAQAFGAKATVVGGVILLGLAGKSLWEFFV